jgi:hypothetical protein
LIPPTGGLGLLRFLADMGAFIEFLFPRAPAAHAPC